MGESQACCAAPRMNSCSEHPEQGAKRGAEKSFASVTHQKCPLVPLPSGLYVGSFAAFAARCGASAMFSCHLAFTSISNWGRELFTRDEVQPHGHVSWKFFQPFLVLMPYQSWIIALLRLCEWLVFLMGSAWAIYTIR